MLVIPTAMATRIAPGIMAMGDNFIITDAPARRAYDDFQQANARAVIEHALDNLAPHPAGGYEFKEFIGVTEIRVVKFLGRATFFVEHLKRSDTGRWWKFETTDRAMFEQTLVEHIGGERLEAAMDSWQAWLPVPDYSGDPEPVDHALPYPMGVDEYDALFTGGF